MIGHPLNDSACLTKLSEVAAMGTLRPDVRALAERFPTTAALQSWIRALPQRDDDGDLAEGPRVACDVPQRVRLAATDPNCVERSILYLAAAEVIDPLPVRQLATIDTPLGRHTFPVEDGDPVRLDPAMPRNALRAGMWALRQAEQGGDLEPPTDPGAVIDWLCEVAADVACRLQGAHGQDRVARARLAFERLLDGRPIAVAARDDILYALRAAGEDIALFGEAGDQAFRVARRVVAQLFARVPARNASVVIKVPKAPRLKLKVDPERAVYWTGKTIASGYGLGGLYDLAYAEVVRRPGGGPRSPPVATVVVPSKPAKR